MLNNKKITISIERFSPSFPKKFVEYTVQIDRKSTLLDVLVDIRETLDPTLSFRRSCRSGICGSCAMNINGKNGLACETLVWGYSGAIKVRPIPGFAVLTDLVVDLDPFYAALESVATTQIADPLQTSRQREALDGFVECIHCAACTSACPQFLHEEEYPGPAFFLKAWSQLADSRRNGKSVLLSAIENRGLWACDLYMNCVAVCAKGLNPTAAIINIRNCQKLLSREL